MVIADAVDNAYDSGVFIEAGSLSSPGVTIEYDVDIDGYLDLIEGCNNGYLTFDLSYPAVDSLWVPVTVSGTATNGVDYTTIPDSVLFEPGDTTYTIPIEIIEDAIDEGLETIVLYVELGMCDRFSAIAWSSIFWIICLLKSVLIPLFVLVAMLYYQQPVQIPIPGHLLQV